jgi:hypothetical protein
MARDANGTVLTGRSFSWVSSNPAVATVSPTGLVTAISPGSATITAAAEGVSGHAVVQVGRAISGSWSGTIVVGAGVWTVEYTLTQSGAGGISGSSRWLLSGRVVFANGTVSGSQSGNSVTMTTTFSGFNPFSFAGTLDATGTTIVGALNGSGFVNQSLTLRKFADQPALAASHRLPVAVAGQALLFDDLRRAQAQAVSRNN